MFSLSLVFEEHLKLNLKRPCSLSFRIIRNFAPSICGANINKQILTKNILPITNPRPIGSYRFALICIAIHTDEITNGFCRCNALLPPELGIPLNPIGFLTMRTRLAQRKSLSALTL